MRLTDLDYDLPAHAIAQAPIEPRDAARLLVDGGAGAPPAHAHVADLPGLLADGDVVVVNDTRVIPARLHLQRPSGGHVEVLLLEPIGDGHRTWEALVKPGGRLRVGERLVGPGGHEVEFVGRHDDGSTFVVTLLADDPLAFLAAVGEMPLPPYITTPLADQERYQTVYSREPASAAAPTAGLHLTDAVLGALERRGIPLLRVELVVGLDTFRPVTEADPLQHRMHSERYHVPEATAAACRDAKRVVAVGTTAVRALESAARRGEASGRTDLFIHRPYDWQVVDVLMTNFHLPRTTLLLMIDAFIGPRWRRLYAEALAAGYRFLSFGDAMLLTRGVGD